MKFVEGKRYVGAFEVVHVDPQSNWITIAPDDACTLELFAIIDTDNFSRDYPNEHFYARDIPDERSAAIMCAALNEMFGGENAQRYYRVVPNSYVLVPGFEP